MDSMLDAWLAWWTTLALPFLAQALPTALKAVFVLLVAHYSSRRADDAFRGTAVRAALDPSTTLLGSRLIRLAILAVAVAIVLELVGIPPTTLVAAIGVAGLAVSLALQDLLRNFFSGVYLLFERPFQIGDRIRIRDHEGLVDYVGFRTTRLRTDENVEILIPNSLVVAEIVANRTRAAGLEAQGSTEGKKAAL